MGPALTLHRVAPGFVLDVPRADDGAVEPAFVDLVLRALTSFARLTFPVEALAPPLHAAWEARGEDHARELPLVEGSAWTRHLATALGFAEMRGLLSTRRVHRARALFDDGTFAWSHGSQVVLLSAPEALPPEVDAEAFEALFGEAWAEAALGLAGVLGALRPGAGGAACFALRSAEEESTLLAALAREAEEAGRAVELAPG